MKADLKRLRREFEAFYGERLVGVVLYGSQARGEARPDSDVDLMVVFKGPVEPCEEIRRSGGILSNESLESDELVTCIFVSERDYSARNTPLLINVRREGVWVE